MKDNSIQSLLRQVVNPLSPNEGMIVIVREYDLGNQVIVVEPVSSSDFKEDTPNKDNYIYGVKLSSFQPQEVDTYGYLIVPKIKSYVIISPIENSGYYVSMFSQIEQFQVYSESNTALNINNTGVLLEGDFIALKSKTTPMIGMSLNYSNSGITIFGEETDINIVNNYGSITLDKEGLISLGNTAGVMSISNSGKIKLKNSGASIKKDILDKVQKVLVSLDAGLTGLGVADPTRTLDITTLLVSISLLLED